MRFDPTIDYGNEDLYLADDETLVYWHFSQLIVVLIALSSEVEQQLHILDTGFTIDEIVSDFEIYFTQREHLSYDRHGLLTVGQMEKLWALSRFFEERSGDKCPDFWNDDPLIVSTSPDWQTMRSAAKEILVDLHMEKLTLEMGQRIKIVRP